MADTAGTKVRAATWDLRETTGRERWLRLFLVKEVWIQSKEMPKAEVPDTALQTAHLFLWLWFDSGLELSSTAQDDISFDLQL